MRKTLLDDAQICAIEGVARFAGRPLAGTVLKQAASTRAALDRELELAANDRGERVVRKRCARARRSGWAGILNCVGEQIKFFIARNELLQVGDLRIGLLKIGERLWL